ncbi:MAG: hypothetical protein JWM22_1468 [Frankiales bacterium]|nr:hypothetical protein [Frankiales bacterium]
MRYSAKDLPVEMELGEIRTRAFDGGGTYTRHISLPAGTDFTPLFVGLPGDLCPCPHWGQVLEGSITLRYADGTEEVNDAGDVFYWPGGHTGWTTNGVVFLELSPTEEILPVLDHLSKAMQSA